LRQQLEQVYYIHCSLTAIVVDTDSGSSKGRSRGRGRDLLHPRIPSINHDEIAVSWVVVIIDVCVRETERDMAAKESPGAGCGCIYLRPHLCP
jgi:hypothetical protein